MKHKGEIKLDELQEYPYMEHVNMSCNLLYLAWHELYLISNISQPDEVKLVSGAPFYIMFYLFNIC